MVASHLFQILRAHVGLDLVESDDGGTVVAGRRHAGENQALIGSETSEGVIGP